MQNELVGTYTVPDFPKYKIERFRDGSFQIISYHMDKKVGRVLSPGPVGLDGECHFNLWEGGGKELFTSARIRAIMARQILKDLRENMNTTKTSLTGTVQRGDFIVGSIRKDNGNFSTSMLPARHPNVASAKAEAARLAGVDKTKKYVVLHVEGIASVDDIRWE